MAPEVHQNDLPRIHRSFVVLGSSGMLGRAWTQHLGSLGVFPIRPTMEELDLAASDGPACITPQRLARMTAKIATPNHAGHGTCVVNCAAYTDVDRAESEEHAAREINAHGVARLARACRAIGATLVHYSTDYVFDGQASEPYSVDHPRAPINAYGRTKAEGEAAIEQELALGLEALIIRTSWLYAPWGRNFVRTIVRRAIEHPSLKVVHDQRGRPTSAEHLARASLRLLESGARGTFHMADGGACSWFDLASHVVASMGMRCEVLPCTTREFPRPARRPAFSVLDLRKSESLIGPMPDWRENVRDVLGRLEPDA